MKNAAPRTGSFFNWKIWLTVFVVAGMVAVRLTYFTAAAYRTTATVRTDVPVSENKPHWLAEAGVPAIPDPTLQATIAKALHGKGMNVEYRLTGPWQDTELGEHAPVKVSYEVKNPSFTQQAFELTPAGNTAFTLAYTYNGLARRRTGEYGKPVHEAELNITVDRTGNDTYSGKPVRFTVYSDEALAAHWLSQSVAVTSADGGACITVTSTIPEKAQTIANLVAGALAATAKADVEAIDAQLAAAATRLDEARTEWHPVNMGDDDVVAVTAVPVEDQQRHLLEVKTSLELQTVGLDNLSQYMRDNRLSGNAVPEFGTITDPVFAGYITQLNEKIARRRLLDGSQATMLDNEIEFLKSTLAEGIRNTRKSTAMKLEAVDRQLATLGTDLPATTTAAGDDWQARHTAYEEAGRFYNFLLGKKMEAQFALYTQTNECIQEAALPGMPVNTPPLWIWLSCLAGALATGTAWSLIHAVAKRRRLSGQTMRIVGTIGNEKSKQANGQVEALCANLLAMHNGQTAQVITVTSQLPGEGTSWVTARLARSMAAKGLRVLVLDMNAAHPDAAGLLGAEEGMTLAGLYDRDVTGAVRSTATDSVSLMTGGFGKGTQTWLAGGRFHHVLETLKPQYDIVLIDTEDLTGNMGAVTLLKLSDAGLLVLGKTSGAARQGRNLRILTEVYGVDNLFCVFNSPKRAGRRGGKVLAMPRRHAATKGQEGTRRQHVPLFKRAALWFY